MTDLQTNKLNMYDAVSQFLTSNNAVWSGNTAISAMVTSFNGHLTAINSSDAAQKTITAGITQSKEAAKTAMANAAMTIANAGKAYANAIGNIALAANFNVAISDIKQAKDTDADDICQNIHDALNPFIANTAPYGATAAMQTTLQNAIVAFSALIGKPRSQKSISVNATLNIAQHFEAADALLKNQLDPIMGQFETTNTAFYNQYKTVRVIVDSGKHHTVILSGFVYDKENNALVNAAVEITGSATGQKVTGATGQYKFLHLHPGSYTITVNAGGFTKQTKTVTVTENGTVQTDFTMVPAVVNIPTT